MIRPVTRIHITSAFTKSYRKLPHQIQEVAKKKDKWFRHNASDPRLKTHKLRGELQGYWSYSVNEFYFVLSVPMRSFITMLVRMTFTGNLTEKIKSAYL